MTTTACSAFTTFGGRPRGLSGGSTKAFLCVSDRRLLPRLSTARSYLLFVQSTSCQETDMSGMARRLLLLCSGLPISVCYCGFLLSALESTGLYFFSPAQQAINRSPVSLLPVSQKLGAARVPGPHSKFYYPCSSKSQFSRFILTFLNVAF